MKKKTGIIILIVSVVLIVIAFLFKPVIIPLFQKVNILPKGCQEAMKMKGNQAPLTKEEEVHRQHEADNREYEETNIYHSGENIAFEHAETSRFLKYEDGIVSATETELACYSKDGQKKWSLPIQYSSPVLATGGKHILIFEKGGSKISVYNEEKLIFSKNVEGKISTGSISAGGDCVIVFEREGYKGSVLVYNKSGDEVYLWNSGKYGILDADISKSRRLAVSLINTEGVIDSKIYLFDIDKPDVDATVDIDDSIAFDIVFDEDTLNAFCDNRITGIAEKGEKKWSYSANSKEIVRYAMTDKGEKVVAFDKNNASEIILITKKGEEKTNITTNVLPDIIDIYDDRILYNEGRVMMITSTSGELKARYTCLRDIKKAFFIDKNNIFIVYASSIEFLDINGG